MNTYVIETEKSRRVFLFVGSFLFLIFSFHIAVFLTKILNFVYRGFGNELEYFHFVPVAIFTILISLFIFLYQLWKFLFTLNSKPEQQKITITDKVMQGIRGALTVMAIIGIISILVQFLVALSLPTP